MPRATVLTASPPALLPEVSWRSDASFALFSKPVRVLVVDDEEAILNFVSAVLADAACDVAVPCSAVGGAYPWAAA